MALTANATGLTNAQYFANFSFWNPNTGTTLPVPKLNITTYVSPVSGGIVQIHQKYISRGVGF